MCSSTATFRLAGCSSPVQVLLSPVCNGACNSSGHDVEQSWVSREPRLKQAAFVFTGRCAALEVVLREQQQKVVRRQQRQGARGPRKDIDV